MTRLLLSLAEAQELLAGRNPAEFGWAPGQGGKMRKVYENPEMVAMARRKRA